MNSKTDEQLNEEKTTRPKKKMTIGEYLQAQRKSKNHTPKSISEITKINQTILKALENNDFDNLPQKPYIAGFIKSYCKALSLEHTEALKILDSHFQTEEVPLEETVQNKISSRPEISAPMGVGKYITAAFIFLSAFIAYQIVQKKSVEEQETKRVESKEVLTIADQPIKVQAPAAPSKKEEPKIIAAELKEVKVAEKKVKAKKEKKQVVEKKKEAKKQVAEKKKEEKKEIKFRKMPKKIFSSSEISGDEKKALPAKALSTTKGSQTIYIKSIDSDSWITFQRDDGKPIKYILKANKELLIKGKKVLLFMGNINAVKLYHNGKRVTAASRSGVKSLVFPQEAAAEYYLPLFIYNKDGTVTNSKVFKESQEKQ